jgi:hypothetical protein
MVTIELTELQAQRLNDVKDVVRWSMDGMQRKAERADENDRKTVTLSTHEAFNVLNVMAFISSLPVPPSAPANVPASTGD